VEALALGMAKPRIVEVGSAEYRELEKSEGIATVPSGIVTVSSPTIFLKSGHIVIDSAITEQQRESSSLSSDAGGKPGYCTGAA
jgi:hypothetical protein